MRALPQEEVHLPFEAGPYRMAMALVTVPEAAWFELDHHYPAEVTERRRLLGTDHSAVFAAEAGSAEAREEALAMIVAALTTHHPYWFSRDGATLRNHLTGESWALSAGVLPAADHGGRSTAEPPARNAAKAAMDPLELAGRLLQDDLCLIQDSDDGPRFTAAVLCFPSRWRLLDKIGRPLSAVHGPVPFYDRRLAQPVDRFMRHLKPGRIASRLNWSVLDDPTLFQPEGKWRVAANPGITHGITPHNAGERLFLRVERQTLRRLPRSGAVLFGIRVHVYPLEQVINRTDVAATLACAVRELPAETLHYKSVLAFRDALLGWLDRR